MKFRHLVLARFRHLYRRLYTRWILYRFVIKWMMIISLSVPPIEILRPVPYIIKAKSVIYTSRHVTDNAIDRLAYLEF